MGAPRKISRRLLEVVGSRPLVGRVRHALRAALCAEELGLLEQQRQALATTLTRVQQTTDEIRDIFDRLPDVVIIHRNGTFLWTNRAMCKLVGYEHRDDLVGRPVLDLVDPISHEAVRKRMGRSYDPTASDLMECWLRTRDGRSILVEVSPSQLVVLDGETAHFVMGRDITDRVRLQQRLFTADRMASIGMLAAGVAHEVNNPLAYVLNNVEIALKGLAPLGEATQQSRQALGVALEGIAHIRTIVRDLLALSRVDDHGIGPIDLRAVVESTLVLAAQTISERAELRCEYHTVPPVRGTAARLGQVLLNLLTNAVEAMPQESLATNELRVVVRSDVRGNAAVVEVTDNGVGILPEHAGRIFDPFFTTKAFGFGTGLGLAISQRLVTEIGGELTFESTPQRGSTFRVTLPVSD